MITYTPLHARMKLQLVGEEGCGKTALCNSLLEHMAMSPAELAQAGKGDKDRERQLAEAALNTRPTEGVSIHEVHTAVSAAAAGAAAAPQQKKIRFSLWDFSGNEAYYATHPLFMSARSVYVLVFRLSDELDAITRKLDYWLQLANCRSGNAPVLLVGTHLDSKRCSKEYLEAVRNGLAMRYATRYNNIKGFFAVSAKLRKGIKELVGKCCVCVCVCVRFCCMCLCA